MDKDVGVDFIGRDRRCGRLLVPMNKNLRRRDAITPVRNGRLLLQ